jgi:hypothetical protein
LLAIVAVKTPSVFIQSNITAISSEDRIEDIQLISTGHKSQSGCSRSDDVLNLDQNIPWGNIDQTVLGQTVMRIEQLIEC